MKRIRLRDRILPAYTPLEEAVNTITHGAGILLGLAVLLLCPAKAVGISSRVGAVIYGFCMVALYAVSTVYHATKPGTAKKVWQIIDHCTIYLLIAGTYTPIVLTAFIKVNPAVGWGLLIAQWGVAAIGIFLNAIDLRRYRVISILCYIFMGWAIALIAPIAIKLLTHSAVIYLLWGGICYTIGAVLYGIGAKKPWFHSVFHIFVVAGSVLQFLAIYLYIL